MSTSISTMLSFWLGSTSIRKNPSRKGLSFVKPLLETLEERTLLSNYTFTDIADTSASFNSFLSPPSLNNAGTVAVLATFTPNPFNPFVISGSGGPTATYPHPALTITLLGTPSINNDGIVAFLRQGPTASSPSFAIHSSTSTGPPTQIAFDAPFGSFSSPFGQRPSINDAGMVAFSLNPPLDCRQPREYDRDR
jgi:hypothetical protein